MRRHKNAHELKQHDRFSMAGAHYRVVRTYLDLDDPEMMKLVFCLGNNTGRDFSMTLPKDTLFYVI